MIQTGDPRGDGTGGESIYGPTFEDEVVAKLSHDREGVLSMANAGRNTNSSQFFITASACQQLDGKHTIFGRVLEGIQAVRDIQAVKVDKGNRPKTPVKLFSVSVLHDPWDGQPLPPGCKIPEKPLLSRAKSSGKKKRSEQCALQ